ncbi:MAG: DUF5667 domain-containing protein [bacterium]|nr:DUF5667 domain-containing protein [bacterium]
MTAYCSKRNILFCVSGFAVAFFLFFALQTYAQVNPDLTAQLVAQTEEVKNEVNIEEQINLDENFTPEDFNLTSVGLLPTNPFYFFKSLRRGITDTFTFDPAAKAELKFKFAAEKLLEAQALADEEGFNENQVRDAIDNFRSEVAEAHDRVESAVSQVEGDAALDLAKKLFDSSVKYEKTLGKFERELSPEAFDDIQEAKDQNAETFGAVFGLGEAGAVSEKLIEALDEQKGSDFKYFKNIEVLKAVESQVPEQAKDAIQLAQNNALSRLQNELEKFEGAKKAIFEDFVKGIGGNEVQHLEIINELEVLPLSEDLRKAIFKAKEETLTRTEDRLAGLSDAQREKYVEHLGEGTFADVRIFKELQNNIAAGIMEGLASFKKQAEAEFVKNIGDTSQGGKGAEVLNSINQFHDAKSITVLDEIEALIPADKRADYAALKQKAATKIKEDVDNARNASQRQVIYDALAGDHPEYFSAFNNFNISDAIAEGIRKAQSGNIQERVEGIKDEDRLKQYEKDFNTNQAYSEYAPTAIRQAFRDKRQTFASPDRAIQRIKEADNTIQQLTELERSVLSTLGDTGYDSRVDEIERLLSLAERRLNKAEMRLASNDVGGAFEDAKTADEVAQKGIRMAKELQSGVKRVEQYTPDFLPKDFYTQSVDASDQSKFSTGEPRDGFRLYNKSEFSQYCSFMSGFMKADRVCAFSDGRVFDRSSQAYPIMVPPEFSPISVVIQAPDRSKRPVQCRPMFAPYGDFCSQGKLVYDQFDQQGCPLMPRCAEPDKKMCPPLPAVVEPSCPTGQYRQYGTDQNGCTTFGTCRPGSPTDQKCDYQDPQSMCPGGYECTISNECVPVGRPICPTLPDVLCAKGYYPKSTVNSNGCYVNECVSGAPTICPATPYTSLCKEGYYSKTIMNSSGCPTQQCVPASEMGQCGGIAGLTCQSGYRCEMPDIKGADIMGKCVSQTATPMCENWKNANDCNSASVSGGCVWKPEINMCKYKDIGTAPYCGDGVCYGGEDSYSCAKDCWKPTTGGYCGDRVCNPNETAQNCQSDCGSTATAGETYYDTYYCSDGIDNDKDGFIDKADSACMTTTGGYCGDKVCNASETSQNCWSDCGAYGANCNMPMTESSCVATYVSGSNTTKCAWFSTYCASPGGTTTACNYNNVCDAQESSGSCPKDCGSTSFVCSSAAPMHCGTTSACTSIGGIWCSSVNQCYAGGTTCPSSTTGSCTAQTTSSACYTISPNTSGGCYWATKKSGAQYCQSSSVVELCSDGIDNDGDEYIDMEDPECTSTSTGGCSSTYRSACTTATSCAGASGVWCSNTNYCYAPGSTCGSTTTSGSASYTTSTSCAGAAYFWCPTTSLCYATQASNPCSTSTTCSSTNLSACASTASCSAVSGVWCSNVCYAAGYTCPSTTTTSTCSSTNPTYCTSQSACTGASNTWCPGTSTCHTAGYTCPSTTVCGNAICESGETGASCVADCGPTCTSSPSYCTSQSACSGASYTWCPGTSTCHTAGYACPATCSSSNPTYCTSQSACTGASNVWCSSDSMCHSNSFTCPSTTTASPGSYTTSSSCAGAGYYWCATYNMCYMSSSGCTTSTMSCNSNGACESNENYTSCPADCGGSGSGSGCGMKYSQADCTAMSGCTWSGTYCMYQ